MYEIYGNKLVQEDMFYLCNTYGSEMLLGLKEISTNNPNILIKVELTPGESPIIAVGLLVGSNPIEEESKRLTSSIFPKLQKIFKGKYFALSLYINEFNFVGNLQRFYVYNGIFLKEV